MRSLIGTAAVCLMIALFCHASPVTPAVLGAEPKVNADAPTTLAEARGRARLLHETIHATLQIVHHEYYREDEALKIPAATLRTVFRELADRQDVELRWLAVNAQPMNVDHQARGKFDEQAVKELSAGKDTYEQAGEGTYRYAGRITLTSDCLKCHAPNRTSNQDRAAALVITLPLGKP
jgi:hypothetical protein